MKHPIKDRLSRSSFLSGLTVSTAVVLCPMVAVGQEGTEADAPVETLSPSQQAEENPETERVVITGSRLRREADATVPVTTITGDQIELRAFTNTINAIEELPFAGLGSNIQDEDDQFGANTANADLLNLQTNRTLTLVNGRRFVSSNQATVFVPGNANGAQVDLSLINPGLIESVETVIGSAGGATYGADAVAGVVNLILKDDFDGVELSAQGGVTEFGDGENYQVDALVGRNFLDGRLNVTAALEYFDTAAVDSSDPDRLQGGGVQAGFPSILNPFNQSNSDGIRNTIVLPGATNPLVPTGGLLVGGLQLAGTPNNAFFPNTPVDAFTAAGLGTPFQFAQTPAGQGIDPLLFVGTFGDPNSFLTVPNPDPATSAFLPNLAVPLAFDGAGQLAPFNVGDVAPPNAADQNSVVGGDGLPVGRFVNIQSGLERFSANLLTRFDVTDSITYRGEYFFADVEASSIDAPFANAGTGSSTAGSFAVPIFIDENPFFTDQARGVINDLVAQGLAVDTIGDSRALYLSRSLGDLTGSVDSGTETTFFRTAQVLEGEFSALDRDLFWDVAVSYGRVENDNFGDQLLDVEFALAADVVLDANGDPACRQQTLAAPEPIAVRNPGLGFINTGLDQPVTPSQAQIDACVPLNLFGQGAPSQAAINYVTASTTSNNVNEQIYASGQFGGDLVALPAGDVLFSTQIEYRREENEFTPGTVFSQGLGRNTLGQGSSGSLDFIEGGAEFSIPVIGGDVSFVGVNSLDIEGAVRVVSRTGESDMFETDRVTDVTFNAGGRWSPVEGLTFRGTRSRAVRSPSIVELFGAGVTGFSGVARGNLNPCDADSIDGGPAGGVRRRNCEAFAASLGLPADFLDTFQAPGGSAPAAGASNPLLENEQSDSWTVGLVFEPAFAPNLTLAVDYYALDLVNEIALTSLSNECFDQEAFPNSEVDGIQVCDTIVFSQEDPNNPGQFIVPEINPLTGNPVLPAANPGAPAQDQLPLTSTFAFFSTVNLGATQLRSLNTSVTYTFALEDVFTPATAAWGDLTLRGFVYYLERFDESATGTFQDTNPRAGEIDPASGDADPTFSTRFDATHQVGPLTHQIQWFRTSALVNNVNIDALAEQAPEFRVPVFDLVNYNLAYNINDSLTARLAVDNLLDAQLDEDAGIAGDLLGRRFVAGVTLRF